MNQNNLKLGVHIRNSDTKNNNLNLLINHNINYFQLYVIGPNDSKELLTHDDIINLKKLNLNLIIHGSHLDHILGSKSHFSILNINKELQICKELGAIGLIIHIPNKKPIDIINELKKINKDLIDSCRLYLEIGHYSTKDKYNYAKIKYLNKLFKLLSGLNIGLCIDTAHLWASGVEIDTYENAMNWLNDFNNMLQFNINNKSKSELIDCCPYKSNINKSNILLHLNDQKWQFNLGSDEHTCLTCGTIWNKYNSNNIYNIKDSGLFAFINWAIENNIITILERKTIDEFDKDLLLLSILNINIKN